MRAFRPGVACVAWLVALLVALGAATDAHAAIKTVYVHDDGTLTRTPQAAVATAGIVPIDSKGDFNDWVLAPPVAAGKSLVLSPGNINATLVVSSSAPVTARVELWDGAPGAVGSTLLAATAADVAVNSTTPVSTTFVMPLAGAATIAAGRPLGLRVINTLGQGGSKTLTVHQYGAGVRSTIAFATSTFVNVDSVAIHSAVYPGAATKSAYARNNSVYVRAVASDPFGSADISGATLTLTDPGGTVRVAGAAMPQVADSGVATRTYEYTYVLPSTAPFGQWTATVTASEGTEGTVTHAGNATFQVALASLSITKSHTGNFTAGTNGTYSIVVQNNGGTVTGPTTVTDTLPAGLTFVSGTGTGWSCGAAGQAVTCTNGATIANATSLPTLNLTVAVAGSAPSSVSSLANVSNPNVNGGASVSSNTDTTVVVHPDLSNSATAVLDLNGGDAEPGDVLRYTVSLVESAGGPATSIGVTDDMPAGITGFTVVSTPPGSTNASTGGGGANATGRLDVTGISVPASGTATIVFDITVGAGAAAGFTIDTAPIAANPNGPGGTATAPTVTVSQSQVAASGNKLLYVYDNLSLTRTPQPAATTAGVQIASGGTSNWTLAPPIPAGETLVLPAGDIGVNLVTSSTNGKSATVTVALFDGATQVGPTATQIFSSTVPTLRTFTIALPAQYTLAAGAQLVLRVTNTTGGNVPVAVSQYDGVRSDIKFATSTVVNVDSVNLYSSAFPGTTTKPFYAANDVLYVRAVVSDPFGSADIGGASIRLLDGNGVVQLAPAEMTMVADSGANARTYEYQFTLPSNAMVGFWTATVTGREGTEGTITHLVNRSFGVGVAQLTLAMSHAGDFVAGTNGSYTLVVHNNGDPVSGTTTVTDTLPAGLSFVSGTGTGWSCSAAGQVVTCTNATALPTDGDLPPLALVVAVAGSAPATVNNVASVANAGVDGGNPQNSNTDATTILHPDLSTSTLSVLDLNGGDANPGDVLRYTIDLHETAGAAVAGVGATVQVPAGVAGFTVVDVPAGSTDASVASGGANGTGLLDITGIALSPDASDTIAFEVTIGAGATPGATLDATAIVANPNGPGATAAASTITVSQSQVAASGNKLLYLYDNGSLTRTPQPATNTAGVTIATGGIQNWTLAPAIPAGKSLVLDAGNVSATMVLNSSGNTVSVTAALFDGATQVGTTATQNLTSNAPTPVAFTIPLSAPYTLVAGRQLVLRVTNTSNGNRPVTVHQYSGTPSVLSFSTATVVNVDTVAIYAAPYPATTTKAFYAANDILYVRAVVSDPFGSADVGGATVSLATNAGAPMLSAAAMTQVADSGVATRTYERAYTVPVGAAVGFWTASVTGREGTEGTVTHTGNTSFGIGVAQLTLAKSHVGDFTAGANGSWSLVAHNNGSAVSGTTTIVDTLPAGLSFVSGTGTGWSCGAAGQVVTCTTTTGIPTGADLPTLTLTVAVGGSAPASVANVATISNPGVDGGNPQNSNADSTTIRHPDLSTSTLAVQDLNGGDANPGDTLRYTVDLVESATAAATGVAVTSDMPAGVQGFTVVSIPAGATNASLPTGGANGTGRLDITGVTVAAGASASVVFDVVVGAGATPGTAINGAAGIANPNGPGASPIASTIIVSQSQVAASGNKLLYLYDNATLTRTPQVALDTGGVAIATGGTQDWTLSPAIPAGKSLELSAGNVTATLVVDTANQQATVTARLFHGATQVGTTGSQTFTANGASPRIFTIALAAPYTVPAGAQLVLRVGTTGAAATVHQYRGAPSTLSFATTTVVNVDSVAVHSEAYPAATTAPFLVHGNTAYIRAVVSDPFGSADVGGANITLTDPGGTVRVNNVAMTQVADSGVATRTYEYQYNIPPGAQLGSWTAGVVAREGTEGTVTHSGNAAFAVQGTISAGMTWVDANAGDSVALTVAGGTGAVAGSSTAPSTTTPASGTSTAGATITLSQAFTVGSAGSYSLTLTCTRGSDGTALPVSGLGLDRTITMPVDSSVACTWTNTLSVPLTVVTVTTVHSDPLNGTVNPKAVPGALVTHQLQVINPAPVAVDADTVVVTHAVPAGAGLFVGDLGAVGSGPVSFADGVPASGLAYVFVALGDAGDDVSFSADNGATFGYVPTPDANGVDASVTHLRVNPGGVFAADGGTFQLQYRVRVE